MDKQKPLISVIIPVYNPGAHLYRCLDSVTGQTYQNLEIILIDDGSTDGSAEICDAYAEKDARVICMHQSNQGVSNARNQGLRTASGDYLHFPDSDDYLEPDTYEYLLGLIEAHDCEVVNFEHFVTYADSEQAHAWEAERYGLYDRQGAQWQLVSGVQFCCNKLFRASLIRQGNVWFREDIHRGEDKLFAAQAIDNATRIWFDPRPLYHYVQSEQSACRGSFRPSQLSVLLLYEAYRALYEQPYPDIWHACRIRMQESLISIYYDMWADAQNWKEQQKQFAQAFRQRQKQIPKTKLGLKKKIKFALFGMSPALFCLVHKLLHKI